ncbi:RNA polymerase sigma factor SigZ [Dongshaea marina]|uniref:RNA polymerase sigma factor SigZ n=1 Tax=Dongshaea marina TaxID=2047966 RepID=UPI000D3E544A|nr:RNA polymerase sigma factor SigZ [Dongshaea marina]
MDPTNNALLKRVWGEYQQALKAFLHSKVSNDADVDELLQEILIKTYQNLSSVREMNSIKAWLFQLANHTIIDFYRKHSRDNRLTNEQILFTDDDYNLKQELARCITPFVQALPEQEGYLLQRIDLDGHSQKLIAEQLGVSYSTLKSRVQKSRINLKKLFEDCCHLSLDSSGNLIDCEAKSGDCDSC